MKYTAICIRCGTFKKDAFSTCQECQLTPNTDFEAARALILSVKSIYGTTAIGRTKEELATISETIRKGRPYPIDGEEQKMVVREYSAYLKSLPTPTWYQRTNVKWAALGLIIIALGLSLVSYVLFYP